MNILTTYNIFIVVADSCRYVETNLQHRCAYYPRPNTIADTTKIGLVYGGHYGAQLLVMNFRIVPVKGMPVSMVHDNKYRMKS